MSRRITDKIQENIHEAGIQGREWFEGYCNDIKKR